MTAPTATRPASSQPSRPHGALTLARPGLIEALTQGMAVVTQKPSLPILASVLVTLRSGEGVVTFQTTNLEQSIRLDVPAHRLGLDEAGMALAEVQTMALPAKRLLDILRSFGSGVGSVTFTPLEGRVRITGGRSKFELPTFDASEFPATAPADGFDGTIPCEDAGLGAALVKASGFASVQESRPILNGVLLEACAEGLVVIATDSYKLYREVVRAGNEAVRGQWILPVSACRAIADLMGSGATVALSVGSQRVRATATAPSGVVAFDSGLIEGPYPNYRQVIPTSYERSAILNREALTAALKQVRLVAGVMEEERVTLAWTGGDLTITATTPDAGQAEAVVQGSATDCDGFRIGANASYLQAALAAVGGEDVSLTMQAPSRAVVIRDASLSLDHFSTGALVLPLRLPD